MPHVKIQQNEQNRLTLCWGADPGVIYFNYYNGANPPVKISMDRKELREVISALQRAKKVQDQVDALPKFREGSRVTINDESHWQNKEDGRVVATKLVNNQAIYAVQTTVPNYPLKESDPDTREIVEMFSEDQLLHWKAPYIPEEERDLSYLLLS